MVRTDSYTYKGVANDYVSVMNTGSFNITVKKDLSDRYTGKVVKISGVRTDEETVEYLKVGDHATHIPKKISYNDGTNLEYTYDHNGNITEIKKNGEVAARNQYLDIILLFIN